MARLPAAQVGAGAPTYQWAHSPQALHSLCKAPLAHLHLWDLGNSPQAMGHPRGGDTLWGPQEREPCMCQEH